MHVKVNFRLLATYHFREVLETHFVSVFELAVIGCTLLDTVVGQVDVLVFHVVQGEFAATSSNVAVVVEIALE